jgi:hypothetical protein
VAQLLALLAQLLGVPLLRVYLLPHLVGHLLQGPLAVGVHLDPALSAVLARWVGGWVGGGGARLGVGVWGACQLRGMWANLRQPTCAAYPPGPPGKQCGAHTCPQLAHELPLNQLRLQSGHLKYPNTRPLPWYGVRPPARPPFFLRGCWPGLIELCTVRRARSRHDMPLPGSGLHGVLDGRCLIVMPRVST